MSNLLNLIGKDNASLIRAISEIAKRDNRFPHIPPGIGRRENYFPFGATTCAVPNDKPLTFDTLMEIKQTWVPAQPQIEIKISEHLPTKSVQKVRHRRKSSRRWQKKYLKRFGTKQMRTGEILQIRNLMVMDKQTHDEVMKKITGSIQRTHNEFALGYFK